MSPINKAAEDAAEQRIKEMARIHWSYYLVSCACHLDYGNQCRCEASELADGSLRDLLGNDWHMTCLRWFG